MNFPNDRRYCPSHEWVLDNGDGTLTIGVTEHAQDQLGDVVFVETPEVDRQCEANEAVAVVESVKAASDIYAPVSGKIIDTNGQLMDSPESINDSPYEQGWIYKMQPDDIGDLDSLLDADRYEALIAS